MTDLAGDISPAEPLSTSLDTDTQTGSSGGGAPRLAAEPVDEKSADKPSLRDTIAAVVKDEGKEPTDKAEAKPEADKPEGKAEADKAEDKPKVERGTDGKFTARAKEGAEVDASAGTAPKAEAASEAEQAEKPGDAKQYQEPPKSFQADSREVYRNTPRAVRRDIDIMARAHEAEMQQARQSTERYEAIRPFDELARSNGRDLRESLQKINNVENALRSDPVVGLNEILKEIGPRKADGSAVTIYEVAEHIMQQGPQQYQQRMQQAQSAQPAPVDPRLTQTQQALSEAHERLVTLQVIEPFKAEHPRFDELQEPIAQILQSGMIKNSLSAPERLEAAYVMAERLNPPSSRPAETEPAPAPTPIGRAADSFNGSKSIKSAPGSVSGDVEVERGGPIGDVLREELRRMKAR